MSSPTRFRIVSMSADWLARITFFSTSASSSWAAGGRAGGLAGSTSMGLPWLSRRILRMIGSSGFPSRTSSPFSSGHWNPIAASTVIVFWPRRISEPLRLLRSW